MNDALEKKALENIKHILIHNGICCKVCMFGDKVYNNDMIIRVDCDIYNVSFSPNHFCTDFERDRYVR